MKQADKYQTDGNLSDQFLQAMADEYKASALANPHTAPHLLHLAHQAEHIIDVRGHTRLPDPVTITLLAHGQYQVVKAKHK